MRFSVYILKSEVDGSLYKGQTSELSARLMQHNEDI
ncbi:MAG: GIY-YIG nuclease family protein [Flavobacteriales bacterium]|nr:GIY-YIG nuclease family protein [Flavobacteriales bacterium]